MLINKDGNIITQTSTPIIYIQAVDMTLKSYLMINGR